MELNCRAGNTPDMIGANTFHLTQNYMLSNDSKDYPQGFSYSTNLWLI